MYNLAICFTYFIEMLISYSFFSLIGEKKLKVPICFFVGTVLFLSGALFDIILSNTLWFNALYFTIINIAFSILCFSIKVTRCIFYSILLNIIQTALEFVAINLISIVTNTDVTAYNKNFPLLMIDAIISKTLYLFTCIILARFIKKEKTNIKFPIVLYMYPVLAIITLLIIFLYVHTI